MKLLMIAYAMLFAISIFLLETNDVRPVIYYIVMAILATLVLLQILQKQSRATVMLILLQVMLLMVNLIWGVTLKYYFFFGNTDLFDHTYLMNYLLATGHLTSAFGIYEPFPLWHIMCVYINIFAGINLPMNTISCIFGGIIWFFLPPSLYVISVKLFKNRTISLLCALIAVFYPILLFYGMYSIPRTACSFLFIILFMLLLGHKDLTKFFLAVFITLAIVVYHTVSIPYILLILLVFYVLYLLFVRSEDESPVNYTYLILAFAVTLGYWLLNAQILINTLISDIVLSSPSGSFTKSIYTLPLNEWFNYLQYSPSILFVIFGTLVILRSHKFNNEVKILSITAFLLIPVAFPGPLMLINKLAGNFNFERFEEYTFLFIGLVSAVGFYTLYHGSKKYIKIVLIGLFLIWVLLSISNDWVAQDNPLVKRPFYTDYLTYGETSSMGVVYNITSNGSYVLSDYITVRYSELIPNFDENYTMILKVYTHNNTTSFLTGNAGNMILIRDTELNKRPMQLFISTDGIFDESSGSSTDTDYYTGNSPVFNELMNYSRVYSSNTVSAYIT